MLAKVCCFARKMDFFKRTTDDIGVGILDGFHHMISHVWFYIIIGVNKCDAAAGGFFDTGVASGRKTLIFLMNKFDTGVFFGIFFGYLV